MGDAERLRFEDAEITLDGKPARGALDLMLTGKLPMVAGTLAFDTLDLRSFLSAFTPLEPSVGAGAGHHRRRLREPAQPRPPALGGAGDGRHDRARRCRSDGARQRGAGGLRHLRRRRLSAAPYRPGLRFDRKADGPVRGRDAAAGVGRRWRRVRRGRRHDQAGADRPRHGFRHPEGRRQQLGLAARERQRLLLGELRPGRAVRLRPGRACLPAQEGGMRSRWTRWRPRPRRSTRWRLKANVANGIATIEKAEVRSPLHRIAAGRTARSLASGGLNLSGKPSRRSRRRRRRRSGQPLRPSGSAVRGARRW